MRQMERRDIKRQTMLSETNSKWDLHKKVRRCCTLRDTGTRNLDNDGVCGQLVIDVPDAIFVLNYSLRAFPTTLSSKGLKREDPSTGSKVKIDGYRAQNTSPSGFAQSADMRERVGCSLPVVVRNEVEAGPLVRDHVAHLATIHADEASSGIVCTPVGRQPGMPCAPNWHAKPSIG